MIFDNDYERFAYDLIRAIQSDPKVDTLLMKRIGKMLETGPLVTTWPRDAAEAAQRARDRAHAARVSLPRPLALPSLPRPLAPPTLPRSLPPLVRP